MEKLSKNNSVYYSKQTVPTWCIRPCWTLAPLKQRRWVPCPCWYMCTDRLIGGIHAW